MVVAPSRWRQKAAKSRNPNKFREASFIASTSSGRCQPTTS
ncbi:Uncharacterised protein [Mycobacteroides abscessus subsp. abscessus]|nr:Uncharacterised protein [Mycobacteroides abscessus subsp. abscessus]